jgi:ribosomal protein S18 acetylase RimI-like enzyme
MVVSVAAADTGDAAELATVAAVTFPLACPASADPAHIAAHIAGNLSRERFDEYLCAPDRVVLAARIDGQIIGYAMAIRGTDTVELSKMYVAPAHHGDGAAGALMQACLDWAAQIGAATVWLGVNQGNERAQRFYRKHGFVVTGTRTFQLGPTIENDFVMMRRL